MLFIISFLVSLFLILIYFSLFRMSTNAINVMIVLIALIPPFVGPGLMLVWTSLSVALACSKRQWEIENDIKNNETALFLQDNKLTHWLFNTSNPLIFWKDNKSQMINENGK